MDTIYEFWNSAKLAGYNLTHHYMFQSRKLNIQHNIDLYKKYETDDRAFMDAHYTDNDISPFINQTLMDQLHQVLYYGPCRKIMAKL